MESAELEVALQALGDVLKERGLEFDLAVVGGGGLLLLGLIERATKDLDVVALVGPTGFASADPLPEPLSTAVRDVAELLGLDADWLNCGPTDLLDHGLPEGFERRAITRKYGALTLRLASRRDQVFCKLYAAVDSGPRSKHTLDLRKLKPTRDELIDAAKWARSHDPSDGFRQLLHSALNALGVEEHGDV